jgi:aldose 1-epimerase
MINIEKNIKTSVGDVTKVFVSQHKMELTLLSYGASIYSLTYEGVELTVRPDDLDAFLNANFYYGKTVGRTAGRLIAPSYEIDGISYPVKPFRGETTKLHGGERGYSYRHFELVSTDEDEQSSTVIFKIVDPDGEEDYPGELTLFVTYTLTSDHMLRIDYHAESTKDTLCSITNHIYVNLDGKGTINQHGLFIDASHYIALDENLVPLKKATVEKTPFDLRKLTSIEGRLKSLEDTPIGGYDHSCVFDKKIGRATLTDSKGDLTLDLETDYPALVIFAHNIPSPDPLPEVYGDGVRSSLTLECEFEPGGIHYPDMSDGILRKGETYHHFMSFKFSKSKKTKK